MIKIRMSHNEFRCRIGLLEWEQLSVNGKTECDFFLPDLSMMRISLLARNQASLEFYRTENSFSMVIPADQLSLLNAPGCGAISSEYLTSQGKVRWIVEMDLAQMREKQTPTDIQDSL